MLGVFNGGDDERCGECCEVGVGDDFGSLTFCHSSVFIDDVGDDITGGGGVGGCTGGTVAILGGIVRKSTSSLPNNLWWNIV